MLTGLCQSLVKLLGKRWGNRQGVRVTPERKGTSLKSGVRKHGSRNILFPFRKHYTPNPIFFLFLLFSGQESCSSLIYLALFELSKIFLKDMPTISITQLLKTDYYSSPTVLLDFKFCENKGSGGYCFALLSLLSLKLLVQCGQQGSVNIC